MRAPESIPALRIVASPTVLDELVPPEGAAALRLAGDDLLILGAASVQVAGEHLIVDEAGFLSLIHI